MSDAVESFVLEDALVHTMVARSKEVADNVFLNNALIKGVKKYDGVIRKTGGTEHRVNLEYAMGEEEWFGRGAVLATDTPNTLSAYSAPLKNMAVPCTIFWEDEQANKGDDNKVIDYVETKIKNVENTSRDRLEYRSWQSGNADAAIRGIPDLIGTGTIFGIDPSTYDWWASQVNSSVGDFETNGLDAMGAILTDIISKGQGDGAGIPHVCMGDADFYEAFMRRADERHYIVDENAALGPYKGPAFRGVPVMLAPYAPAGTFVMLNFKFIKLIYSVEFEMTKFQQPVNSLDRTAFTVFRGAWALSNRRVQGKGEGCTY